MDETGVSDLEAVPWLPPTQRDLGIEDARLVAHVRDVTAGAVALVHDVSKLAEFDAMRRTRIGRLLGHPYYRVHVVARADLPVGLAHIVLSHTSRTTVEPATLEAEIVRRADEAAAAAIRAEAVADLRGA